MEVIMNMKQLPTHVESLAGFAFASTLKFVGYKMKTVVTAASVAAVIGLAPLTTACADPASRTPDVTAGLVNSAAGPREENCQLLVRGKYTVWRCEHRAAEGTQKAIARTP
jgi:hypothetical protein